MSSIGPVQRRASYGPTSPQIGRRGSLTRDRIIAETLQLLARQGFQDTTVHDIAEAAEMSRATLYQYFASKDEIVRELLDECSTALIEVVDGIGQLGPTAQGFEQLRRWIDEWSAVHDRYGVLFVRWAGVDLPGGLGTLQEYEHRLTHLLRAGGLSTMSPDDASTLVTDVVHRFNYLRFAEPDSLVHRPGAADEVAIALQLVLFPATPHNVLSACRAQHDEPSAEFVVTRRARSSRLDDITADLTPRSSTTVRRIVDAGAEAFAEQGYHRAHLDEILRQAGFARGTFYKYFADKADLLLVLADEFEDLAFAHILALGDVTMGAGGVSERLDWTRRLLELRNAHLGVMRALIDLSPHSNELDESRERFHQLVMVVFGSVVETAELHDIVTAWSVQVVMIGALDRLPTAEALATVLERCLFGS